MFKVCFYIIHIIFTIICIGLSGCSDNSDNQENNTPNILIRDVYIDILQNKSDFSFQNENIYLKEFLNSFDDEYTFKVTKFAVLDMNGDGIAEIILQIIPVGPILVLHYDADIVYGYWLAPRGMGGLKKDGTFRWSSGAGDWGYSKLRFSAGICEVEELCRIESNSGGHLFYINDEQVSEDVYYSFVDKQSQKEYAGWYEFSAETIAEDFAKIWDSLN